jgi:hypothetical protein
MVFLDLSYGWWVDESARVKREQFGAGTGDDMGRNKVAHAFRRFATGVDGSFDTADIAFHDSGDKTAANLDVLYQADIGRFNHGIAGLDEAYVTAGFY